MKYKYLAILWSLFLVSCQFFETEKISSETFYEEELKAINWEDVDQYPAFSVCDEFTEKKEQKQCFETTLGRIVHQTIESKNIITGQDINSTVLLAFNISNTGEISNLNIEMDTVVEKEIPLLRQWLIESIDSLPQVAPAYKRGIPVKTKFILPLVINSEAPTN
jgi:hypothetical protein